MEQISRVNEDILSSQSADLLHKLLAIDSETVDGVSTESASVQTPESAALKSSENANGVVRVQIPYFGIVNIVLRGVISKEMASEQPSLKQLPNLRSGFVCITSRAHKLQCVILALVASMEKHFSSQ